MKSNKEYNPIDVTTGYYEGYPMIETISAEEQKDWIGSGGTISELIDNVIELSCDWQRDC